MNKEQFTKIFELEDYQVLITKEYGKNENGEDIFVIRQKISNYDQIFSFISSFYDKDQRDKYFEEYNQDSAKKFIKNYTNYVDKVKECWGEFIASCNLLPRDEKIEKHTTDVDNYFGECMRELSQFTHIKKL